jgi:hypothetical protein
VIGVTIDSANGAHLSFAQHTIIHSAVISVVLAAPVAGMLLALSPERMGSRSGKGALVDSVLLVFGGFAMTVPSLDSW